EDQGALSARPDRFVDGFARWRVLSQFGDDVLHVQRTGFSLRLRFFSKREHLYPGWPRTSRPGARSDANESGNAEFQSCRIAQLDEHAPKNALFRDRGNENRARAQQSQWNGSYSLCFFGATWLHCTGYNFRP